MDTQTPLLSFDQLKHAVDEHFGLISVRIRHDYQHVAMLCNIGKLYSPVSTWLYVAKDETGRHYITKRRTTEEDVELMKLLMQ